MRNIRQPIAPLQGALVLLCAALVWSAPPDTVPQWLDTLAPLVTVEPQKRYQARPFAVTLGTDERAVVRFGVNPATALSVYRKPIDVVREGVTTIFYEAEDDFGNISARDSAVFVLDTRPPQLAVSPDSGTYPRPVLVRFTVNEPCRLIYRTRMPGQNPGRELGADSLLVTDSLLGYVEAFDSAGNSASVRLWYRIDTTRVVVRAVPDGGAYNTVDKQVSLGAHPPADVYYTFDPLAPADWFRPYTAPLVPPYGVSTLRYYARAASGLRSEIGQSIFVIDTVPPKLQISHRNGTTVDTLILSTREQATIWYSLSDVVPLKDVRSYKQPLTVARKTRAVVRAIAQDQAGNKSDLIRWEYRYDTAPPTITASRPGGTYTAPFSVSLSMSEAGQIFYTLDGSAPTAASPLYTNPVPISKDGTTLLRFIAVDEAGNESQHGQQAYVLDSKRPAVKARVEQVLGRDHYLITLTADKRAAIFYEVGGAVPTGSSPTFFEPIPIKKGQILKYLAIDNAGNRSDVGVLEEIDRPLVVSVPGSGIHNRKVSLRFETNIVAEVYWRLLPDTTFRRFVNPVELNREGLHTIEYYAHVAKGIESPLRRNEYLIDLTPPQVEINLKRGVDDSVSIFLESSERAIVYYTLDGTSPLFSATTRIAGKGRPQSNYRISMARRPDMKLAFFAEDAAQNQGALAFLDLTKPRAMPSIPAGTERVHDRYLSIAFTTLDPSAQIYYGRHGQAPTLDSSVYREPVVLLSSDTICAFVMDASGTRGDVDTFVYLIDIPPSPRLTFSPPKPLTGDRVTLNGSGSMDQETPRDRLLYRWDFDGNGVWDTEFRVSPVQGHSYSRGGVYHPVLEVRDRAGRTASSTAEIRVGEICPAEMVFVAVENGQSFCIDRYEYPGRSAREPLSGISWVEAKVTCANLGKRLCTGAEWTAACAGGTGSGYPYGNLYLPARCPTEGEKVYRSGSFRACGSASGAQDMIGNVWEWIDDKEGDYPQLAGGSYQHGKNAYCGLRSPGTVGTRSGDIGFRCCR